VSLDAKLGQRPVIQHLSDSLATDPKASRHFSRGDKPVEIVLRKRSVQHPSLGAHIEHVLLFEDRVDGSRSHDWVGLAKNDPPAIVLPPIDHRDAQ
jgi:hypothetical protein